MLCRMFLSVCVSCTASLPLSPPLVVLYFALLCIGIRCLVAFLNSTCQEFITLFVLGRLLLLYLCTKHPFEQAAVVYNISRKDCSVYLRGLML